MREFNVGNATILSGDNTSQQTGTPNTYIGGAAVEMVLVSFFDEEGKERRVIAMRIGDKWVEAPDSDKWIENLRLLPAPVASTLEARYTAFKQGRPLPAATTAAPAPAAANARPPIPMGAGPGAWGGPPKAVGPLNPITGTDMIGALGGGKRSL